MTKKQFKDMKINSLVSFLGTKATDLKIKAANNTEVDIDGIVTFSFCISNLNDIFKVTFVITKQNLSTPIIGFNIIEHLVKTYPDSDFINPILNSAFPHLNSVKTEVLVNLVQEKNNQSDFVGTENCAFPQNFHTRKLGEITEFFALKGAKISLKLKLNVTDPNPVYKPYVRSLRKFILW